MYIVKCTLKEILFEFVQKMLMIISIAFKYS